MSQDMISSQDLRIVVDKIKSTYKLDLSEYKVSTLKRRIMRRMHRVNILSCEEYISFLNSDKYEISYLLDAVLINYTRFFRDSEVFEKISKDILPELVERKKKTGQQLRIWCPGCATGEEAYSFGILVKEFFKKKGERKFDVVIYATDIDVDAINKARSAVFSEEKLEYVDNYTRNEYFKKKEGKYFLREKVRRLVKFGVQDIISDAPISRIDLLSCRNVLIYFTKNLQKKVFPQFYYALNPGGYLILGKAEKPSRDLRSAFDIVDPLWKVYRKRGIKKKRCSKKGFDASSPSLGMASSR